MAERAPTFLQVLERMYKRRGLDALPDHLERTYGFSVSNVRKLDVGVLRVDRAGDTPLVARVFPAARSRAAAEADLAVLRHLEQIEFRAERPYGNQPLSEHEGQAVLVTSFVRAAPKARQPAHPIARLGRMIGRLHRGPVPPGADRPAGALHHFAEGTMTDELRAAGGWLDDIRSAVATDTRAALDTLRAATADADGGDGLPEAFVHPDPVPKNAIFTADGPVLVDWTSAGRGPRLAALTMVLRSNWAAAPFMNGYARDITLEDDERSRLAGLLFSRALVNAVFRVCLDHSRAPSAAAKLPALRRESEAKARAILTGC